MFESTITNEIPACREFEVAVRELERSVAEVVGVINAANGRLVELVGDALDRGLWRQVDVHSPGHWLGWQAGMTAAHAQGIVKLAERRSEVPATVAALVAGELSVDAAVAIGKRVPVGFDEGVTEFAKVATMGQLEYSLREYRYDRETEKTRPKPRDEQDRLYSSGVDAKGRWWCKARLSPDEGAVFDQAVKTARDDRYRLLDTDRADRDPAPTVSLADGFLAVGEAALAAGAAAHPGSDRYLVHLHLDASPRPDDPTGILSLHLGRPLPTALHGLLTCDSTLRPIFKVHGTAISIGRTTRVINRRTRRIIEQRDRGCRVPGCGRTFGLDIHHLTHWEHGGPTDTDNLVCLCRRHHRLHHQGHLAIEGNPDLTPGTEGALRFTDHFGRTLDPTGHPIPLRPGHTPSKAAKDLGIAPKPGAYQHPLGERLQRDAVTFNPNRPRAAAPAMATGAGHAPAHWHGPAQRDGRARHPEADETSDRTDARPPGHPADRPSSGALAPDQPPRAGADPPHRSAA